MDNITLINGSYTFECEHVAQAEGFEAPTVRDVFIDPPEREGSLFINEVAGMRQLSWRGLILNDIQTNRRLLARVCQPGGLKTIKFELCDGVQVQTEATLKLTSVYSKNRSPYLITAKAPNPFFLSQELHEATTGVTVRKGGMPIKGAIPAPIGAGGGSPFTVLNAGDTLSRPIFVIQGPGTNFLVQNLDTGESFRLVTTLTSSDIVTIDTNIDKNTVVKGSENLFGLVTRSPIGSWVTLQGGSNRIVFSAISGTSAATKLTIKWRDSYSGF